jgi:hypothetical protein
MPNRQPIETTNLDTIYGSQSISRGRRLCATPPRSGEICAAISVAAPGSSISAWSAGIV